jgi:uncharacterized membrane protein YbaN (DUF454 family)
MHGSPEEKPDRGGKGAASRSSWLLAGAGWLCTVLGVAGIFLPLVPTVPLLLLAAACFARSSPRWHAWLIDHPRLGPLVADYLDGGCIPLRAKVMAIAMVWLSVSVSLFLAVPPSWVRGVVLCAVIGVTLYLLRLPTCRGKEV